MSSGNARTVLVADDTAFVRERFKSAIEGAGHRALTVQTAGELLGFLHSGPGRVDLIVLDLRLPHGGGPSLLRRIRSSTHELPIVVFAGTIGSRNEVRQLAELGVVGYVNEYMATRHIAACLVPHLLPEAADRRSRPRVSLIVPVSYRFDGTIATSLTMNVGAGGLAIRTAHPLPIGTTVAVRFRLPTVNREIQASAHVVWADRCQGMGLRFDELKEAVKIDLDVYVESHFFSNRKA